MGVRGSIVTVLVALSLLGLSPAASAGAGSLLATAPGAVQGDGNAGGNGNGNAGGNGNGNGYGTSTTTTTTTLVESTTTTQLEATTTTQPETTTTTVGGGDYAPTTTTTAATPATSSPVGSGPADGGSTTTTFAPSTSTTLVPVPGATGEEPSTSTSTTLPQDGGGTIPPGGPDGDVPVEVESRPAFFADFAVSDRPPVAASGETPARGRLGALFETWAWSEPGGGGLTGATFEMLAAVIRAIMTAGSGMAVPASVTVTLLVLSLVSRHRSSDGAIPSA